MNGTRRDPKARGAILATVLLLAGWALAGPGRLTTTALLERVHHVELSVAGGHVDLRLGHAGSAAEPHRHPHSTFAPHEHEDPIPSDHVIHLCAAVDLLPPRVPIDDGAASALVGSPQWARPLALDASTPVGEASQAPRLFAPGRSVPLLL